MYVIKGNLKLNVVMMLVISGDRFCQKVRI